MLKVLSVVAVAGLFVQPLFSEEAPWNRAYQASCRQSEKPCSEDAMSNTGKFLDYARFGFVPSQDLRLPEQEKIWSTFLRDRKDQMVTVPSPAPLEMSAPMPTGPIRKSPAKKPIRKKSIESFLRRAQSASDNGRYEEAETYLLKARAVDPTSSQVESDWQRLQQRMGQ